jgi:hypothetical protein
MPNYLTQADLETTVKSISIPETLFQSILVSVNKAGEVAGKVSNLLDTVKDPLETTPVEVNKTLKMVRTVGYIGLGILGIWFLTKKGE